MTRSTRFLCAVGLASLMVVPLVAQGPAQVRPIDDFLAVQLNTVASWCTQVGAVPDRCVAFDAFGKRAEAFGLDLGTTFAGSVMVRELADGAAHVSVVLHTRNALCWGGQWDETLEGYLDAFGYNATGVSQGNPAALGDGLTKLEFTMPSADAPLPNYAQLMYIGHPDYPLLSAHAEITCKGLLRAGSGYPEGTPGAAHVTQVLLARQWYRQGLCPAGDCWPAEVVSFRPTGR